MSCHQFNMSVQREFAKRATHFCSNRQRVFGMRFCSVGVARGGNGYGILVHLAADDLSIPHL